MPEMFFEEDKAMAEKTALSFWEYKDFFAKRRIWDYCSQEKHVNISTISQARNIGKVFKQKQILNKLNEAE